MKRLHNLQIPLLVFVLAACNPPQPPLTPSFTAAAPTSTTVQLSWTAVSSASSYVLERGKGAAPTAWSGVVLPNPTTTTATDTALTASTTYTYRLKATNAAGSSYYVTKAITTLSPPPAPVDFSAVPASPNSVNLSWSQVTGATKYRLQRGEGSNPVTFIDLALPTPTVTSFKDTGLTTGLIYTFRVQAITALGEGVFASKILTLISDSNIPAAPTNFNLSVVNSVKVNLSWTASSTATSYSIERGEGATPTSWLTMSNPTTTTPSDGTVRPLATYTYRIKANNSAGSSAWVSKTVTLGSPTLEVIASGMDMPWSLNFASDGRLFFTPRNQTTLQVRMIRPSSFSGTPLTGFTTYTASGVNVRLEGESGILGMDLDPNFATNNRLYICYSYSSGATDLNRVSRFEISGTSLINELKMIDAIPGGVHHNGCRVQVAGGYLFATMGDVGDRMDSQIQDGGKGRMFRVNLDGTIPTNNPFYSTAATNAGKATWNYGMRNVQGMQLQPGTSLIWSTEHGENTRDEINTFNINSGGNNYGWPLCAGTQRFGTVINSPADGTYNCNTSASSTLTAASYVPAVLEYEGGEGDTIAPSDMVFYPQAASAFTAWQGDLFFVTLKTGRLYRLALEGSTITNGKGEIVFDPVSIGGAQQRLRDVTVGPDGYLYISTDVGYIFRLKP